MRLFIVVLTTLGELRNYIRNAIAPGKSDREQLQFIAQDDTDLGSQTVEQEFTVRPDDNPLDVVVSDPYVLQDRGASTIAPASTYKSGNLRKAEKRTKTFRPPRLRNI